jgi:hypothetical protein
MYFLIENSSQIMLRFKSLKALKEYAKQHNLKIKKSWDWNGTTYYTESYVTLPTGEID